jgi:hypothetical protein
LTASALAAFLLLHAAASTSFSKDELVLDTLMVGDLQGWVNHLGDDEPAIDITLVPARAFGMELPDEYLHRLSRIYFPRNKDSLLLNDVLFFYAPRLDFFTSQQQAMMADFVGTEGKVSIAYPLSNHAEVQIPWLNSPLSGVFPVDMERFAFESSVGMINLWWDNRAFRLARGLPPVFSVFESTGIYDVRVYRVCRPCYAKEGATTWLYMIDGPPGNPEAPAFVSWPYGDSEAWAFGAPHPGPGEHWESVGTWWELVFLNIFYHSSGKEILSFEEGVTKRSVKTQFSYFRDSASLFQSIVDFVSKVGANTVQAESILGKANQAKSGAETDYLERRYGEAGDKMQDALQLVERAMDEAQQAKDSALFWVYVSEWLATTAVALISGVLLWWLMVRRSLYKEVAITQLRHSENT